MSQWLVLQISNFWRLLNLKIDKFLEFYNLKFFLFQNFFNYENSKFQKLANLGIVRPFDIPHPLIILPILVFAL